ncbi:molybdopterin biosynthesis protein [Nocardia sp. AG03]|uniref:molybdopterin biosynthesis protein n=1 Tax=Nocardia sp. AG03 TaxID=3025312 RepID=UPI002418517E|nr:molybdopterin biosynthesis protein [Nocardia sp. AG03]
MAGGGGLTEIVPGAVEVAPAVPSAVYVSVLSLPRILRRGLAPLTPVTRVLADAVGATLAAPLVATTAEPAMDAAALDGYAVSGPGPWWTVRPERVHPRMAALTDGESARIAHGTPTPRGTTAVLRAEDVMFSRVSGRVVLMRAQHAPLRDDTRVRGEQWHAGTVLAAAGSRVGPAVISVGSSAEIVTATVRGPVSADVLVTGNRLTTGPREDAVTPVVASFLAAGDIRCRKVWQIADGELLRAWFAMPAGTELVIVVGALDEMRCLLTEIGADIVVDGVMIRPGGEQMIARLPDGRTLIVVPANPFEAITALMVTGRCVVDALTDRAPGKLRGRLVDRSSPPGQTTDIVPVTQVEGGVWRATGAVGIPHLAHLVTAQALALLPPGSARGTLAELILLPR